ncbi:MAG: helix-turn-helix domain-containing protein [Peptococcaceae bacterium]|nr:helix-turn-helix domain-containing protein [Peptococcaceae bacterium]
MGGPRFNYTRLSNRDLLEAIKSYTAQHGYSPTIRELAKITGAGLATVHRHLNQLIYGGYIEVEQPRRRLLRVVKDFDRH